MKQFDIFSKNTLQKFKIYQQILEKWQSKINLISRLTVKDAFQRHFMDSAQLYPLIPPQTQTLMDLGSGAGFPALVLAILNQTQNPVWLAPPVIEQGDVAIKTAGADIEKKNVTVKDAGKKDALTKNAAAGIKEKNVIVANACTDIEKRNTIAENKGLSKKSTDAFGVGMKEKSVDTGINSSVSDVKKNDISSSQFWSVTVVESDQRKCCFMDEVARQCHLRIIAENQRVERVKHAPKDVITARALADLTTLLDYSLPFVHSQTHLLFLKGQGVESEICDALTKYDFSYHLYQSQTDEKGKIIEIEQLMKKG